MRQILRVSGEDRISFLQGLITNDVTTAPCWAAMLTPQGKYLADFLVVPQGDALLLDIHADLADGLMRRLTLYKLRSKVQIEPVDMGVARGTGPMPEGALQDPRHQALGWRHYGVHGDDGSDWDAIRVAHTVPESLIELIPDETYILEAGFERLHGVDFRKGCYVGQEVTARMKHKAQLRKGLVTVQIEGSAPAGTPIMSGAREAGRLFTQSGGRAIAYLRFDRISDQLRAGSAQVHADPVPAP